MARLITRYRQVRTKRPFLVRTRLGRPVTAFPSSSFKASWNESSELIFLSFFAITGKYTKNRQKQYFLLRIIYCNGVVPALTPDLALALTLALTPDLATALLSATHPPSAQHFTLFRVHPTEHQILLITLINSNLQGTHSQY